MHKISPYKIVKGFFFALFIFNLTFSFSSCSKTTPASPNNTDSSSNHSSNDTLAKYSLIPSMSDCSSTVASGATEIGRPFTSNNLFYIYVHVSRKGYWSYPKTTLAGMSFSGSGNFSDTGTQQMKLYGTGTPEKVGSFDFPLNVGGVNCFFRDIVWPAGTFPPPDSSTALYYRIQVGTHLHYQEATQLNGFIAGSSVNGTDDVSLTADIGPDGPPYPTNSTSLSVTKGIMHNYLSSSNIQFKSYFSPGTYNFTTGPAYAPFQNGNGFHIEWTDSTGKIWTTYSGTGDQTGSAIEIISVDDSPDPINYYIRVKLRFTCKLYREDTGEAQQLLNGEFDGLFGKF